MQIHGHDPVDPCLDHHVGDDLGGNRYAGGADATVLTGIAEVGNHGGDPRGGGAAQGVHHQDQFHQVVVGRRAGGLQDEDILAAHVLIDLDRDLAVAELPDRGVAQSVVQALGDLLGELGIGVPGENHQF